MLCLVDYQTQPSNHNSLKSLNPFSVRHLDARQELGISQLASLRVASKDGGFLVFATTPLAEGEKLHPGDVVLWVPYEYSKEAGGQMSDKRSGWVGLIRAKLKPEINPANPSFVVACRY